MKENLLHPKHLFSFLAASDESMKQKLFSYTANLDPLGSLKTEYLAVQKSYSYREMVFCWSFIGPEPGSPESTMRKSKKERG